MSEISFNSILDGVSLAIHAAFPDRRIHSGEVKQGLKSGDFNVIMPGAGHTLDLWRRYKRTPTVDVIYYPRKDNVELYDMADRLSRILESIPTPEGDIIHAASCTWSATDEVLHVLVAYPHFVYVPQEEVKMDTLKLEQKG